MAKKDSGSHGSDYSSNHDSEGLVDSKVVAALHPASNTKVPWGAVRNFVRVLRRTVDGAPTLDGRIRGGRSINLTRFELGSHSRLQFEADAMTADAGRFRDKRRSSLLTSVKQIGFSSRSSKRRMRRS